MLFTWTLPSREDKNNDSGLKTRRAFHKKYSLFDQSSTFLFPSAPQQYNLFTTLATTEFYVIIFFDLSYGFFGGQFFLPKETVKFLEQRIAFYIFRRPDLIWGQ